MATIAEAQPLLPVDDGVEPCRAVSAQVTTLIIKRILALANELIPIEVDLDEIKSPTSGIITKDVISAFSKCAGDFSDCIPYCLLTARLWFHKESLRNPSDYDENQARKMACEVLARRIVNKLPIKNQHVILSTRYTRLESDGDESNPISAMELACDQQCTVFLSSAESQRCTFALWNGYLIQSIDQRGHVVYTIYDQAGKGGFLEHFDVARLSVPRYNNLFRITLWVLFIFFYTIALQTPAREFGFEDVVLYVQVIGYSLEILTRAWKIFNISILTFWMWIDLLIYSILLVAFGYRIADLSTTDPEKTIKLRLKAFQLTSTVAPLVWAKLLPVWDTWPFFGTLQIVVNRMMRESAVFFALLILLAVGFAQALIGLDVIDTTEDTAEQVYHSLLQGLLGSPTFDVYQKGSEGYPFSMILYYLWSIATLVILLNVLVALFGSAYQDVTDDAMNFYLSFFASKTVSSVRAPDSFVYVAPFNLLELLVLPLEPFLSRENYAMVNRVYMRTLFFIPLCAIALYESFFEGKRLQRFAEDMEVLAADDFVQDPETPQHEDGKICTVSFDNLTDKFPDLTSSVSGATYKEVKELRKELLELKAMLQEMVAKK